MTIEKFKQLTNSLPADTVLLIDSTTTDTTDVEMVSIEYHSDGRAHLVLSNKE